MTFPRRRILRSRSDDLAGSPRSDQAPRGTRTGSAGRGTPRLSVPPEVLEPGAGTMTLAEYQAWQTTKTTLLSPICYNEVVPPSDFPTGEPVETTIANPAFELARRGRVWADFDAAPGALIPDPTTLHPGDIVVTRGYGRWRAAVIISVGRKNAKAVFMTPGAIADAEKILDSYKAAWADLEHGKAAAAEQAGKNFDFYVQETDPATRKYLHHPEATLSTWKAIVAAGREAFVADAEAQHEVSIAEGLANHDRPLADRVLYTEATVKPGQAKLLSAAA